MDGAVPRAVGGCDPETEEEWESTWLGPDALTKDLLAEAREEVERERYGEVVGEKGRNARKRERVEPRREGGEVERQAEARVRCEAKRDAAAASLGKVARKTPRVAALRAADVAAVLAAQGVAAAAASDEVPMDHGSEEEDEAGAREVSGAKGAGAETESGEREGERSSKER